MQAGVASLFLFPAIATAQPAPERKTENLPNANWQEVPGATVGRYNPVETSMDINGLKRKGNTVTFDVIGYKGFYRRLQADCQSRQVRVLREGRSTGATTFSYIEISEKNAGPITNWHRVVSDHACQISSRVSQSNSASEKLFSTRKFSIRYPANWVIQDQGEANLIVYNQRPAQRGGGVAPAFMVKTDVTFAPGGFENYNPPQQRNPDIEVVRTQKLTINGRQAVRLWTVGGDAFSNAIVTFIQYSDQETAIVVSFYNSPNRKSAEPLIQKIHASFKLP